MLVCVLEWLKPQNEQAGRQPSYEQKYWVTEEGTSTRHCSSNTIRLPELALAQAWGGEGTQNPRE